MLRAWIVETSAALRLPTEALRLGGAHCAEEETEAQKAWFSKVNASVSPCLSSPSRVQMGQGRPGPVWAPIPQSCFLIVWSLNFLLFLLSSSKAWGRGYPRRIEKRKDEVGGLGPARRGRGAGGDF